MKLLPYICLTNETFLCNFHLMTAPARNLTDSKLTCCCVWNSVVSHQMSVVQKLLKIGKQTADYNHVNIYWKFVISFFEKNHVTTYVQIRNLKVDFKTGGTWRRAGQWALINHIYSLSVFIAQSDAKCLHS